MKAFIFDPLWDDLIRDELLEQLKIAGIELFVSKVIAPLSECKELYEGDEDRLLCINPDSIGWKLRADEYRSIPNLKGIMCGVTSFSWLDMSYASQQNIPVTNIQDYSSQAVAEWAIMMALNVARQTPRLIKDSFPLDFDKDYMKYRGIELHGKTAGIVGLGNIGKEIAKRCEGLGMQVVYWSKSPKKSHYVCKELVDLFSECDVIFPTMAINDDSKKLITSELLKSMKASAMLISVVHGLYDEAVILEMVENGKLYGYGFEAEPGEFSKYKGNVWAAPSYAWVTDGSMANAMTVWVENMVLAAENKFPSRVN